MTPEQRNRHIQSEARDYAYMHKTRMQYADIEAHAANHYATPDEQKAFVLAVLHTNDLILTKQSVEGLKWTPKTGQLVKIVSVVVPGGPVPQTPWDFGGMAGQKNDVK